MPSFCSSSGISGTLQISIIWREGVKILQNLCILLQEKFDFLLMNLVKTKDLLRKITTI